MRQQSKWKRRLALVLAAVMTLSTGMTAMAAEGGWWREDENSPWNYYIPGDGTMVKDKVKYINGLWYSFDADGNMESDTLVEKDGKTYYAQPEGIGKQAGSLVSGKWVLLDEEGHKCTHQSACDCSWYHFAEIMEGDSRLVGGEMATEDLKQIRGQWYSFEENGKMRTERFDLPFEEEDGIRYETFYAFPDGHLASATWVLLDDNWYYFGNAGKKNGMMKDCEKEINGSVYAFDEDGMMISHDWWASEDMRNLEGFYQYEGEKAVSKWLPYEGFWYYFDENGKVTKYAAFDLYEDAVSEIHIPSIASASNASSVPFGMVETVVPVKNEYEVEVSKSNDDKNTVEMSFKVTLEATPADAEKDITKGHDIWLEDVEKGGHYKVQPDGENGFKVVYWNTESQKAGSTEVVRVCMDGLVWSEDVSITVTKAEEVVDDKTKTEEITAILGKDGFEEGKETETVETLKESYAVIEDTTDLHDAWLKAAMENDEDNTIIKLEEAYVKANKIQQEEPQVSNDAAELMGDGKGKVEVIGGGLNAEPNDSVQLVVTVPEEKPVLRTEEEHEEVVSFDIKFMINGQEESELALPVVISMPVPKGVTSAMVLFNIHDSEDRPIEVTFEIKNGRLYFVTDKFSTYVFAKTSADDPNPPVVDSGDDSSSGGSSSGGGSGSSGTSSGQWIQDATGWWFRYSNGSYPADSWQYLSYNGTSSWYHFNAAGYMDSGWFTDADGHIYYLNPVSDGTKGAMMTGWQQIDGQWYYFNPSVGGPQGSMLRSTTTPDGYTVNENGQWIQ